MLCNYAYVMWHVVYKQLSSLTVVIIKLELDSVQAYFFELELGSRVKSSLSLVRTILRITLNELKARLEFASTSLKRAKARLITVIIIIIIIILYYI
ncbi:hypothetical protein Hanom_Chr02g00109241 [Helianthus anomalus]